MGFFGFGKKKEKEQQSAQAEETRLEAQADETSGAKNAQTPAGDAEQAAQDEKKQGLFSRLWQGLSKTRGNVAGRVDELIEATETIDEDFYEDLVDILIMSDMGVRTSDKVIQELKTRVARERITDAKKAREILKDILKEIMGMPRKPLKWPMVMLVVGVNGVGKTTTIGKLAMRFKDARHSVVLAAADTFRAAAGDQLQIWADRAQVPIVRHAEGADPAAVVFDGVQKAKASEADLLIVDTAGRLHNKKNLMEELRKISRVITREYEEAEVRTLLVIDATTGQNGLQQAREFSEVADVSGIVLTKLDGTAKGGIAVAIMDELKLPVLYIGVGEGIEDLQAIISFYLAMNTANIWVLIDDGLDARASVVLMGEDAGKLTSYFRPEFIAQDPVLQVGMSDTSPYRDYEIRGYDHRVKMVSVWSWPWENVARAEVVESIPAIDGTIRSAKREAALAEGGEERLSPPAWTTTRYRVTLVRTAGRWLISNLQSIAE